MFNVLSVSKDVLDRNFFFFPPEDAGERMQGLSGLEKKNTAILSPPLNSLNRVNKLTAAESEKR